MSDLRNVIIYGDSRDYIPKIKTPINCVITDPPFGIDYQSERAVTPHGKDRNSKIENDLTPEEAIKVFESVMGVIIPKLADHADIYVFTVWNVLKEWIPVVENLHPSISLRQMLFWEKGYPGQGDLRYNWGCGHEVILYLKKGKRPVNFRRSALLHFDGNIDDEIDALQCRLNLLNEIKNGVRPIPTDTGWIAHDRVPSGHNFHPTEKPVGMLEVLVSASTDPGDLIVDPFSGSGSTSEAAMKLGRNSLGFEIDERYISKSRARLQQQGFNFV